MSDFPILYLSYDGITDALGQSQILPYIKGLRARGFAIHLVSAEKNIKIETADLIKKELLEHGIHWHYISYSKFPPVLSTIWDLSKIKRKVKQIINKNEIRLTHCRGYITGLIGMSLKRKNGIPFLFDMRGLFADERKDSGNWNIKNPIYNMIYKWFKKKEIELFKNADFIISLTEKGKSVIQNEIIKSTPLNFEVIPCCTDTNKFDYRKFDSDFKTKKRKELNIPENAKVFTYLGSVGTWYMLDEMIDFYKLLSQIIPNSVFLFITNEPAAVIEEAVAKIGADKNRFRMTSQPSAKVPEYLSISEWGLFFILPVFSKQASSPTKLAEFLAMGIPVISNSGVGDVDKIILNNNAGVLVYGTENNSYIKAIGEINTFEKNEPAFYRDISEKYFDVEIGVEKYSNVYRQIIKTHPD